MKTSISTLFFLMTLLSINAQTGCDGNRYFNTIFDNVTVTSDVQYGQNTTLGGKAIELRMDIYEPEGDILENRPLVIFAHGGGFVGGERDHMAYICEDFAQRGFVAASISYRLIDVPVTASSFAIGITMAVHDMKAAIRYFREDAATLDNYRIDPDFIFAGGASAGAIMASTVGYMDLSDNISPELMAIINMLGGIEGNSSTNTQYSSAVQGVLNYSGALPESHYIDANDPPLYSFHDELDPGVPCDFDPSVSTLHGSCEMHAAADQAGIKNQFYLRSESTGHGNWSYGTLLYESAKFLGEVLCENAPDSHWEEVGCGLETPGFVTGDISVVDENIIWTIQKLGNQFSRTSDGGQSWTTGVIPVSMPDFKLVDIQAMDENLAWAMMLAFPGQDAGKMYKTTDGGESWTEQTSSFVNPNEGPHVFHFFDENHGFALGELINKPNFLLASHVGYITSDGGNTWEKLGSDVYPAAIGEGLFINDTKYMQAKGDHLRFGTSNGKMYHSGDRGHTWTVHEVAAGIAIQSVAFKDELNGIAVSGNDAFGKDIIKAFSTSDGGSTWTELDVPTTPRATGIYFVEGSDETENSCGTYIMFNGHYSISGMSISKDGGQTWKLLSQQPVFALEFINPETGWMGGMIHGAEEGGLYKWDGTSLGNDASCVTAVKEQIINNKDLKIFPNPARGKTNIQLENNWQGTLSLQVLDFVGHIAGSQKVEKNEGNSRWEVDLQTLSPGVYQIILSNGQQAIAKSFVKL